MLRKIRKLRFMLDVAWRPLLYYLVLIAIAGGVLFWRLGSLVPGVSEPETVWYNHLTNRDLGLRTILDNPAFLPYQLGIYLLEKMHISSLWALRGISAAFGLWAVASFYFIIRQWYTRRMAIIGASLFLCSAWFLHTARLGTTDILYLAPIVLIATALWRNIHKLGNLPLAVLMVISVILLYVPGLLWLLIFGLIVQRQRLAKELQRIKRWQLSVGLLLSALIIAPLIRLAIIDRPTLIEFLGLPGAVPDWHEYLRSLLDIPKVLFIHGPTDSVRWVGGMPLLDIFMIAMAVIGFYLYALRFRLERVRLLLLFFLLASLFIAAGGAVQLVLLLPFVFIVIIAGTAHFLQEWFDIFPRNPFARILASTLIILTVAMSCFYNLSHYFVAWPHTPATKASFKRL